MTTSKSLDDKLREVTISGYDIEVHWGHKPGTINVIKLKPKAIASIKQAIVEAVEGLIGEDEKPWVRRTAYENSLEPKAVGRNELRAELRKAIKEWQR